MNSMQTRRTREEEPIRLPIWDLRSGLFSSERWDQTQP